MTDETAIPAAGEAVSAKSSDAIIADAMKDLEDQVIDLVLMSEIAWDQIEQTLGSADRTEYVGGDERLVFHMPPNERERAMFAINNVCDRIRKLKRAYFEAYHSGVAK